MLVQTRKIKNFPIVLVGRDFWEPLVEFLRARPLAAGMIGTEDFEHLVVTDSPGEVARSVVDTALDRFGLTYGPRPKPRWYMGER
jgi:predicted Rossmann-fold nucleotide-binding protein